MSFPVGGQTGRKKGNMKNKFVFVLWNPKTQKVSIDIFTGQNIKEAMDACNKFYEPHGNWILTMCEIPAH